MFLKFVSLKSALERLRVWMLYERNTRSHGGAFGVRRRPPTS